MVEKLCTPPSGCYTTKTLFANVPKITTNSFLTVQPDIFKIIFNLTTLTQVRGWM